MISISIFVILLTLTVSGFRASMNADRDVNAISTFRNAIEGARSRAIKSGQIRGLRLITDANNPLVATSLVYVGSARTLEGQLPTSNYPAWYTEDTNGNGQLDGGEDLNGDGLLTSRWFVSVNDTTFSDLKTQGFLLEGNRMRFSISEDGFGTEPWYTIQYIESMADGVDVNGDMDLYDVTLVEYVRPSDNYTQKIGPTGTLLYYQVELSPTILPGAEPIIMPSGYGIDLDGSRVPSGWRIREDKNGNGQIDGSETDVNSSGLFEFATGYASNMDLLFTPDGTMVGSLASEGVLHFVVAALNDISLFQTNTSVGRTRSLSGSFPVGGTSTYPDIWLQRDTENDRKVLSLFAQSGGIVISDLYNPVGDTDGTFNNEYFSNSPSPFLNALLGLEAKR
jgi:Tfp pilus assembly protein FimT